MAKSAKRKAPFAAAGRHARKEAEPNPFEKGHGKQKFNIIGRKNLSAAKNINKARSEAIDKRKKTLLVEYKQLKKANAFVDRRIGEYDEQLTEEEKAIARFQRERLQRTRNSKFTLPESDNANFGSLTHLGNPLSTLDDLKDAVPEADEDDGDGGYEVGDARVVAAAHFGGGADAGADRRTKREVMAEVMAVSKAARAAKRMRTEEDEDLRDAVDERFAALLQGRAMKSLWKAPGERHKDGIGAKAVDDDSAYDEMRIEAVGGARARAADREPTQEEREAAAAAAAADDGGEDAGAPAGGYAARRARAELERRQEEDAAEAAGGGSGAEAEDDFDLGSSEDGGGDDDGGGGSDAQGSEEGLPEDLGGAASLRRGARAAGDDPLQKGLRALTAELLLKHGGKPTVQSLRDLEERGGGSEAGSGEQSEEAGMQSGEEGSKGGESAQEEGSDGEDTAAEEGSEGGSGGDTDVDGSDAGSMDAEEQAALAAQMDAAQRAAGLPAGAEGDGGDSDGSSDDDLLELLKQAIAMKRGEGRDASAAGGAGGKAGKRDAQQRGEAAAAAGSGEARNAERRAEVAERDAAAAAAEEEAALAQLPQAPRVPQAAAELAEMAAGLPGRAVGALVDRIRSANAAALNADHRVGLQAFYGVAMGHFAAAAGARPPRRREVEGLVPALTAIAAEVPLYAAMHARTHLRAMFDTAHDALEEEGRPGWPGPRGLLLLRLFGVMFRSGDPKHPVGVPQALVLGFLLSHCPPARLHDVATGVLVASMLCDLGKATGRFAAEVLPFCEAMLHSAVKAEHRVDEAKLCLGHTQLSQGWLAGAREADKGAPKPLSFWGVLAMAPTSREATSPALRAACLASVLEIVRQQLVTIKAHAAPALEACMGPVQRALAALAAHGDASRALRHAAREVAEEAAAAVAATIAARRPMTCAALTKKAPQRLLNPKFEVDFDKRRDYDPDRERADYREYKRLAAKENRSLKRELSRDAAFMGEVRRKEKDRKATARDKSAKRAMAFLEQQEADFKSGGQGGMNPHKKKQK